jgi:hypothetical protein
VGLHAQMNTSEVCPERVVTSRSEITRLSLLVLGGCCWYLAEGALSI